MSSYEIKFRASARAKRISIYFRISRTPVFFEVVYPQFVPNALKTAQIFMTDNTEWMEKTYQAYLERQKNNPPANLSEPKGPPFPHTMNMPLLGGECLFVRDSLTEGVKNYYFQFIPGKREFHIPPKECLNDKNALKELKKYLCEIAYPIFKKKTEEVCRKHGFKVPPLTIGTAYRQMGVFYTSYRMRLSSILIFTTEENLEFVITHEMCHSVHIRHSREFHELVNHYYPRGEKIPDQEIKQTLKELEKWGLLKA